MTEIYSHIYEHMAIEIENEASFKRALLDGISLFSGAGFSLEAYSKIDGKDVKFPTGQELLEELKVYFKNNLTTNYTTLPNLCLILQNQCLQEFNDYITKRFTVSQYSPKYKSLTAINIKNIFTTNVDDLLPKVFKEHKSGRYIRHVNNNNGPTSDEDAIHYYELHGYVGDIKKDFVFSSRQLGTARRRNSMENSYRKLNHDIKSNSMLFWGWNFEDNDITQEVYDVNDNFPKNRWCLLFNPSEEDKDVKRQLGFNLIIGDTMGLLEYIYDFSNDISKNLVLENNNTYSEKLKKYYIPSSEDVPPYELKDFFLLYAPQWSHIYSKNLPLLSHYNKIKNYIDDNKNVIIVGNRASGKTTILMQLAIEYLKNNKSVFFIQNDFTFERAEAFADFLGNSKALVFVDDCLEDTEALNVFLKKSNIQVVGTCRDYNYERLNSNICCYIEYIDITIITKQDAQNIINILPQDIRKNKASTRYFDYDPTLLNIIGNCVKSYDFKFLEKLFSKDAEVADIFLLICYVHSCNTPCSFDMIYSYLGDENYSWEQMYNIIDRIGKLIKEDDNDYPLEQSQDMYICRSRYFAEEIMKSAPEKELANMLWNFVQYVPNYKIIAYDKFKRCAFDANFADKAFKDVNEGEEYYKILIEKEENEYMYQQIALFLSKRNRFTDAFRYMDKAKNLTMSNKFVINSTYAQIQFDSNYCIKDVVIENLVKALKSLEECCKNDKRKIIHFVAFVERVEQFVYRYPDIEDSKYFTRQALYYIEEGIKDNSRLLSKSRRRLKKVKVDLLKFSI